MLEVDKIEDVTQIKMCHLVGGQALYWVAAYLVDGLLIDTGCRHTEEELVKYLDSQELSLVVNTHHHEDHVGANLKLQEKRGLTVYAHRDAAPLIAQVPELAPYQQTIWGYPVPSQVVPLTFDRIETERFCFEIVETPGHCPGHVSLIERNRGWCFSGDLYAREKPRGIRLEEDIGQTITSMKKLMDCGSGQLTLFTSIGKIVPDGRVALGECVAYLEGLSHEARELERQGLSVIAIRDQLLGGETALAHLTNGQYLGENLIKGVLAARF